MSHPKNTTAPPRAQQSSQERPYPSLRGFEYFVVQVVHETEGFKTSFPGVLDESLAMELRSMLQTEFSPDSVQVVWVAGWDAELSTVLRMSDRMTDMIKSVRSAERPGREFLERLGRFGPYLGYASQNSTDQNVPRTSGETHS